MADFYEVRFTVRLPDGVNATPAEVEEWLRFCLRDTHSMSGVSPLVRFEPEPLRGTFRILPTAGFRCDPASGVMAGVPEREPWVPYLSDRADGVRGHYAICRWNPGTGGLGYREAWNLRRHAWASCSDEVLTLEQAQALLRGLTLPSGVKVDHALPTTPVVDHGLSLGVMEAPDGKA